MITSSLTNVCMLCHRLITPRGVVIGPVQPEAPNQSHGLCLDCAPDYCRQQGLSDLEIARILLAANPSAPSPISELR